MSWLLPKFLTTQETEISIDKQKQIEFKIHIAIDFGTAGTGLSYAYKNKVYMHTRWGTQKYAYEVKPQNNIILNASNECVYFGSNAKIHYSGINQQESNKWRLFTRFKMHLYKDEIKRYPDYDDAKNDEQIEIKQYLPAIDGSICNAEYVFVAAFKEIGKIAKKAIPSITKCYNISDDEIQWIITVPSIWNDNAKVKMKLWATKANLINKNVRNQCKIVYEPDCASLALQHLIYDEPNQIQINPFNNYFETSNPNDIIISNPTDYNDDVKDIEHKNDQEIFKKREKYILIDAGGGTLDVACHEICAKYGVREILPPSGGRWGSCYIDDQYVKLLETIFTTDWIDEFRKEVPNKFVNLICNFQKAKKAFFNDPKHKYVHDVGLSVEFLDFIEAKIYHLNANGNEDSTIGLLKNTRPDISLRDMIQKTNFITLFEDENYNRYLRIDQLIWNSMFDYVINPAVLHITKLLNEPKLMRNCKYICLVGGLSCSKYFQYRMNQEFGPKSKYKLDVIIPNKPILSVVQGAAYFGITQNYIRSRILRKTYGVKTSITLEKALKIGLTAKYIKKYSYMNDHKGQIYVRNYFCVIGRKGDEMLANTVQTHSDSLNRKTPYDMGVCVPILCSDLKDPKTADDAQELAQLTVEFKDSQETNMAVQIEFDFSETVIKVFAYAKKDLNSRKQIELKYLDL